MEGYWKATSISGRVYGLFKVEKSGKTYRYRDGVWAEDNAAYSKFGWDDDYDHISEEEAMQTMEEMNRGK